jgi:integrase
VQFPPVAACPLPRDYRLGRLSAATRRQRDNIFVRMLETAGHEPYARITTATILAGKERRAETPAQARNFLDAMRGLFRWALKVGLVKSDPTIGVNNPKRKSGDGFPAWTEGDVAAYEARWPIGTRQRVWLDVLLYTGFRRGDAVRLGRQHVRDRVASIKTEKSGFALGVEIPILPVLAETLAAGPCGDLAFICGERGEPLTKESFGNMFKDACKAAGVAGIGARRPQDRGDTSGRRGRDRSGVDGDLRLDRSEDGRALHAHRQQEAARRSGDGEAK